MRGLEAASASRSLAPQRPPSDRAAVIDAAERIIASGLWCVVEVCTDIPAQAWERRLAILRADGAAVADAVAEWVEGFPERDVRLSGCRRSDLRLEPGAPTHLCHLAGAEPAVRP